MASLPAAAPSSGTVLFVDDDVSMRAAFGRCLRSNGYHVELASSGSQAAALLTRMRFDAVVSDITMPEGSGVELLRRVRELDAELPVILMTGGPTMSTAVEAVQLGALRYLIKPFSLEELELSVREAVKQRRLSQVRAQAMAVLADTGLLVDGDDRLTAFERALPSIWMAFQPVVRWPENEIYGYEALLRSNDAALPSPGAMLDAAAHLGRLPELGRAVRDDVARQCLAEGGTAQIFVNLHPLDLLDESLYASDAPLSQLASRVVLEITERATLDGIKDLQARLTKLRGLGFRVALDDLGAGYSGLSSFAQLEPEVVKLDMSLIRDVHRSPTKQKLIRSMVGLCGELGSLLLAEGIETVEERDMVASLGCGLMQGYLFARPGKGFPKVG